MFAISEQAFLLTVCYQPSYQRTCITIYAPRQSCTILSNCEDDDTSYICCGKFQVSVLITWIPQARLKTYLSRLGPRGVGSVNFVCYIGWASASSVYSKKKKYTVYQPYTPPPPPPMPLTKKKKKKKKSGISAIPPKISAGIIIPQKIFPMLSFYKTWFSFYFFCIMTVLVI